MGVLGCAVLTRKFLRRAGKTKVSERVHYVDDEFSAVVKLQFIPQVAPLEFAPPKFPLTSVTVRPA